jgi:Ca2+-binding RTX toxin-like protein
VGRGLTALFGEYAESLVDSSGIGRKVYFDYVIQNGNVPITPDYDSQNFNRELVIERPKVFHPIDGWLNALPANQEIVQSLFDKGITRFLDGDKPILYGSNEDDQLIGAISRTDHDISISTNLLSSYVKNGITYIAGGGTDVIKGTGFNDKIFGGDGLDILTGNKGNDYLEGGQGFDFYDYTSGDGFDTSVILR